MASPLTAKRRWEKGRKRGGYVWRRGDLDWVRAVFEDLGDREDKNSRLNKSQTRRDRPHAPYGVERAQRAQRHVADTKEINQDRPEQNL